MTSPLILSPALEEQWRSVFPAGVAVVELALEDRRVWLKRVDPPRRLKRFQGWLQALVLTRLSRGLPPRSPEWGEAWPIEAQRLDTYARLGLAVPRVLALGASLILIEDAGEDFRRHLERQTEAVRQDLLSALMDNLIHWHRQGLWHGGAQLRNLALRGEQPVRFDFEHDHGPAVALPVLQTLDLCQQLASAQAYQSLRDRRQLALRWFASVGTPEIAVVCQRLLRWLGTLQRLPLLHLAHYEYRRLGAAVEALRDIEIVAAARGFLRLREAPAMPLRWRTALVALSLLLVSDDLLELVEDHDFDDDAPRLIYEMEPPELDV